MGPARNTSGSLTVTYCGGRISMGRTLLHVAKRQQFDDGLNAAVELVAQQGTGQFAGKAFLLQTLASTLTTELNTADPAAALVPAACELGGVPATIPETLRSAVRSLLDSFQGNELLARPLGFYTWTARLRSIFRQDRFLQQPLDPGPAAALDHALQGTPGA
jgi:hypothetical protein